MGWEEETFDGIIKKQAAYQGKYAHSCLRSAILRMS